MAQGAQTVEDYEREIVEAIGGQESPEKTQLLEAAKQRKLERVE